MTELPFLVGLGFSNLAMLGWLAAAAAPLLIHLWSRRKYREVPWAAITFLLAAMRKNARRMQLQQWLLLAVRTLIIVLVVVAVAEPYGEQFMGAAGGTGPTHKVLVLDSSYSMAYRTDQQTLLARAKTLASRLVRDSGPGDSFSLIEMDASPRVLLRRDTVDRGTIDAQIDGLAQSHRPADLPATLALVEEVLAAESSVGGNPARHEVYFFTDLQRSTWQDRGLSAVDRVDEASGTEADQSGGVMFDRLAALAERARLVAIDVAPPRAANLAVTALASPNPFVAVGREVAFEATLHQYADQPHNGLVVELLVDDVPVGEQSVDVPAGSQASVRFTHRFSTPGVRAVGVRAAGDALEIDDVRWLAVPVAEQLRVLIVAGAQGAGQYLADALDPDGTGAAAIEPIVVSEGGLPELDFAQFDAIFLSNVPQLTAGEAERLARFAGAGGGVVFFLGDRVIAERYNSLGEFEISAEERASLLPAQLGELIAEPRFGLDPLEYRHPIVEPFRGRERAGLLTTPVARYYRLELPSRRGVEVALALEGGDPLIVAAPLGRGRTIMVATAASLASADPVTGEPWTSWPTWPSFLPVVRELLAYAVSGSHDTWQQAVGAPLAISLPVADIAANGATPLEVVRPDGRAEAPSDLLSPGGLTYDRTDLSGIYRLRGLPQSPPQLFAVNVDTSESDLAKIDARDLPPGLPVRLGGEEVASDSASTADYLPRSAWHRNLLAAALGLLFVEGVMAWAFGRGAA